MSWQRSLADPRRFAECAHQDDGAGRCAGCRARSDPPFVQATSSYAQAVSSGPIAGVPIGAMVPVVSHASLAATKGDGTTSRAFVINPTKAVERHGTEYRYKDKGCRCEECRAAMNARQPCAVRGPRGAQRVTRLLAALRRLVSRLRLRHAEPADGGYMVDLEITPEDTPTYRAWRDNPPAEAANSAEWGQDLGSFVLRWYWQPHPKTSAAYAAGMGRAAERLASPPRYVDAEDVLGPLDPPRV